MTNTHKESALYMEKRIDGSLAQKTDEFQYTVTLTYNNAPYALQKVNYMKNGTDMGYLTTDSNGQVKIMMHGGDNAKISYLPSTAKYKVEETHLGYQSKPITDKDFANEGVLIADKTAYAGYVNIKDKTEVDKTVNKVSRNAGEDTIWTIKALIPKDVSDDPKDAYHFKLVDTMDPNLQMKGKPEVYILDGDQKTALADADYTFQNNTWDILTGGLTKMKAHPHGYLVIAYNAVIKSEAAADTHYPNHVKVEYTGYGVNRPDEENPHDPYVYTSDINIVKTRERDNKPETGAEFALFTMDGKDYKPVRIDDNGNTYIYGMDGYDQAHDYIQTTKDGEAKFHGLKEGTYYLKQTKAPEGLSLRETYIQVELKDEKSAECHIKNPENIRIIYTGGEGWRWNKWIGITAMLAAAAAVIAVCTKRLLRSC